MHHTEFQGKQVHYFVQNRIDCYFIAESANGDIVHVTRDPADLRHRRHLPRSRRCNNDADHSTSDDDDEDDDDVDDDCGDDDEEGDDGSYGEDEGDDEAEEDGEMSSQEEEEGEDESDNGDCGNSSRSSSRSSSGAAGEVHTQDVEMSGRDRGDNQVAGLAEHDRWQTSDDDEMVISESTESMGEYDEPVEQDQPRSAIAAPMRVATTTATAPIAVNGGEHYHSAIYTSPAHGKPRLSRLANTHYSKHYYTRNTNNSGGTGGGAAGGSGSQLYTKVLPPRSYQVRSPRSASKCNHQQVESRVFSANTSSRKDQDQK